MPKKGRRYLFGHHKRVNLPVEAAAPFKIDGIYCRLIPLTKGVYTIVNVEDYEPLMRWKWLALYSPNTESFYAARTHGNGNGRYSVKMHRQILGLPAGRQQSTTKRQQGDHVNGNTLDNRRINLRIATRNQNAQNRRLANNNTSGQKGVTWHVRRGLWQARIGVGGKRLHLGYSDDFEDARSMYLRAAKKYHGKYARRA